MHKAVLLQESISYLQIRPEGTYIDATFGGGSVSKAILDKLGAKGRVVAIDADKEAIQRATDMASEKTGLMVMSGNFSEVSAMLTGLDIQSVDGAIADLGLSSYQLDDGERGYTVDSDSEMDMRYDLDAEIPTAADILKTYSEKDLVALFQELAEQPFTRRIAKAIKRSKLIITPADLAKVVERAIPSSQRHKSKKITVNLLRALRMEVNHELDSLEQFIDQAVIRLSPQARLVVISFQSLEDRVVKNAFRKLKQEGQVQIITKKPVSPTESEIQENPRSRSAKLRVCEKL